MKNILAIVLLVTSTLTMAQRNKSNEDLLLFERTLAIHELIDNELYDSAIAHDDTIPIEEQKLKMKFALEIRSHILEKVIRDYDELIADYPKSSLVFRALNNKGYAEMELMQYGQAEQTFLKIINSTANDKEKGGLGSGIMGEPYANYKNRASKTLAELALRKGDFQVAADYLDLTKKYPYQHFCGNEFAADDIQMASLYSECYIGLGQYEKAYDILLPQIIENGLANNSEIVKKAYNSLITTYTKNNLKTQFESAFRNMIIEKHINGKKEYQRYFITFLNRKIELSQWKLDEAVSIADKEKAVQKIIADSEFYQLLSKD